MNLRRQDSPDQDKKPDRPGTSRVAIFFIFLSVVLVVAALSYLVLRYLRARQLGLPTSFNPFKSSAPSRNYPSGGSGGVLGWFKDRFNRIRSGRHRSTGVGYEEPLSGVGGRRTNRNFGPLDPDEAWDSHVGTEADGYGPPGYYEEQELGLHDGGVGPYGGDEYGGAGAGLGGDGASRGRSRSREPPTFIGGSQKGLDERYDEEMGRRPAQDPFGDHAESSDIQLRSVSPRPVESDGQQPNGPHDHSEAQRKGGRT